MNSNLKIKEKKKWSLGESILLILTVVVLSINSWRFLNIDKINNLYDVSTHKTEVLDRYMTGAGYKVSPRFILILKDIDSGRIFDLDVTPSTYYQGSIGSNLNFRLNNYQIGYRGFLSNFEYSIITFPIILLLSAILIGCSVNKSTSKFSRYLLFIISLHIVLSVLISLL